MSNHTARDMMWHKEGRVDDDVCRHSAGSDVWKEFDKIYPNFVVKPRNVRPGLVSNGLNSFGKFSTKHSSWPVVILSYNLSSWRCMKKEFTIMSLLILGPKSLSDSIDVYLWALIDELIKILEKWCMNV